MSNDDSISTPFGDVPASDLTAFISAVHSAWSRWDSDWS